LIDQRFSPARTQPESPVQVGGTAFRGQPGLVLGPPYDAQRVGRAGVDSLSPQGSDGSLRNPPERIVPAVVVGRSQSALT